MALFTSYAPPGVYTFEIFNPQSSAAIGTARIPVILGEGQQFFSFPDVELFRGSSAVQDDQAVNENISDQVTGFTRTFVSTYHPVVDGTGKGVVTNDPVKMQVLSIDADGNQMPVTVISLDGATGAFATQEIVPQGTTLKLTYFFKRGDTFISADDLSVQIPKFASLTVAPAGGSITLSLTSPGKVGNLVTVQFVDAGAGKGVPDAQAVIGAGTNAIVFEIRKTDDTIRTLADLQSLVQNSSIPTLDSGYLTAGAITGTASTALVADGGAPFTGGVGPSSNTIFKVKNVPIVDGTNGGIVTANPSNVTAEVNGNAVSVAAVDGAHGLITLSNPVAFGSTLTVAYYTNTWQNTFDLLPASNVASITMVGLGPGRSDFSEDIDYVLGTDSQGNGTINWGASVSSAIGVDVAGDTAFSPSEVNTTLVDDHAYLRPASGVTNGKNTVFMLEDNPVDGSGLARFTDDPTLVHVYVGTDPLEAFLAGEIVVARVSGASQLVTLYNPPPTGSKVFASYYRSTLADNKFTLSVVNPGFSGFGTYKIADELGRVMPLAKFSSGTVAASAAFAITGVVYPLGFAGSTLYTGDLASGPGAIDETVTLTFNSDGNSVLVPAVAASKAIVFGAGTLTFTALDPGVAGNNVQIAVDAVSASAAPVVVSGDLVTIYSSWNGSAQTLAQIAAFFPSAETLSGGQIQCVASGVTSGNASTTAATNLLSGADAITTPVTHSYVVSSNQGVLGSSGTGYLNQTYEDAKTGFRVTVVNPADHTAFGIPSLPGGGSYAFAPADILVYTVSKVTARHTGNPGVSPAEGNNHVAIPGLYTKVVSTLGSTTGDTVIVSTFNKSGNNPTIGEFYYVSFTTAKTASDYALKIFTNPSDAYAQYGQPSTVNRLSLGIQLMSLNGVQTFGAIQVPAQPNTNLGSASDYIAALQQLTKHIPGSNRKADVVVPLSSDVSVHQALSRQLISQAGPRQKGEAIGFVGYNQFTSANLARANARALHNARVIAIGNAAAGIMITNLQTGVSVEYVADGPFMAAAMAGLNCNPANDVATTLTLQNLVGFSRLLVTYDDPTMDMMAADGLTMLLNNNGALQIRHYKSTDPSNDLSSEPTSITITDYVAQQFRLDLQQFIGRKLVDSLVTDIQTVCNARLKSLVDNVIISGYQNLSVKVNPNDPTEVDVTVTFKPIFSLLYASVTFVVQTSL